MPAIDWNALANEATDILQRYIRIDTTNPPGNEEAACDCLAAVLSAEGIASRSTFGAGTRQPRRRPAGSSGSEGSPSSC